MRSVGSALLPEWTCDEHGGRFTEAEAFRHLAREHPDKLPGPPRRVHEGGGQGSTES